MTMTKLTPPRTLRALGLFVLLVGLLAPQLSAQDEPVVEEAAHVESQPVEEAIRTEQGEIENEQAVLGTRARAILGAVEDFRGLSVRVDAGIVGLSGSAPSREAADQAVATLQQLDGVLLVVDDVEIERGLSVRLRESGRVVVDQLRGVVAGLPLYGAALAIVIAAWLLARLLRDAEFLYRLSSERALLQLLLRQTVFAVVLAVGLLAALRFLGAGAVIGTMLGAAGILGIALGFAFRNIVENYLAGVLLAVRQPFRARDVIEIDGQGGTVLRMTASETTLMDADGNHVRLPNAMIFNGKVINYTRNPLRRFKVAVGVGTAVDCERALELGIEVLRGMKGVIGDPAPSARIAALGDSSVLLEFFGWVDQVAASYMKVASEAHRAIKETFDETGIDMPPPEYALRFETPVPEPPVAPEAPREAPPRRKVEEDAEEAIDVSPESDIDKQVADELSQSEEGNLLEES